MGVTSLLLVSCLSLTIIAQVLACYAPPAILDGSYSPISSNYIDGDIVQYSCNDGFVLRGSKTRSCTSSGAFYPAAPTCVNGVSSPKPWAITVGVLVSATILWVHY